MEKKIKDKVVLISGGGRGIGRAAVSLFSAQGAKVAFCARTEGEVLGVKREIESTGAEVLAFRTDIGAKREVLRMVSEVSERWGAIDLLINNASVLGQKKTLLTCAADTWEQVMHINVNGTFYLTQAVVREMSRKRSGQVISLTSSVGRKGRATWGAYAVSKFALEGMMQTLAEEVEKFGIRVITLNPEATRTRMRASAYPKEDASVLKAPAEVAQALLSLACSPNASLHGRSLDISTLEEQL